MIGTGNYLSCNRHLATNPGEEIVISGIAGRFPSSRNVAELKNNLMNKKDLITTGSDRWEMDNAELPQRHGVISDLDKFDASYFGIPDEEALSIDPQSKITLEHVYEAIIDAGVNPKKLRDTKTAVVCGSCYSESELTWVYSKTQNSKYGMIGCSKAMISNRISYWLGLRGPSYSVDTACSSSLIAVDQAIRLIRGGECNAAIVCGTNLCLHPFISIQFNRLGVLSQDGRCKSFDENANGYVRSETISAIYLQKAKVAKRVYATILHTKTNCDGYKEEGITFPSSNIQRILFKEFYEECGIPPTILSYLETHGTGTRVGDPEELNAIDKVFCSGRTTPLKIGAVKSNLGHSEPASAMCSIAKVIIAMETGLIPPNINLQCLRKDVECLEKGKVQVITEPTPWELGYAGINSFGFGGSNGHMLLRSNPKEKLNGGRPTDDLPRLVVASGRTEEAVSSLFRSVENASLDAEYICLLHEIHAKNIAGHEYRGYMIVGPNQSKGCTKEIINVTDLKKPVCLIFSGLGSQWPGMGKALMKFSIFSKAIETCNAALNAHNINVVNIITNKDKKIFDNIINSYVGIAAVQIGLVDLLKSMNIVPDYIIGYSFGELACAYADGCITADQVIRSAYYIALACVETKTVHLAMARIALGYKTVKQVAPSDIDIVSHDGPDYCTISGPKESVKSFSAKLSASKIDVTEVSCSDVIYHSRYAAAARQRLLSYMEKVIHEPKARTKKWLSTSVPREKWIMPEFKMCSAKYFVDSLLYTVLFDETLKLIPENAMRIEIAPHGVLQFILEKSSDPYVTVTALSQYESTDNVRYFLHALGKLYNRGLQFQIANIYPSIEFPVSRGTPMISPHIRWDHSKTWHPPYHVDQRKLDTSDHTVYVTVDDEAYEFMMDHVIDGRILVPATGYLLIVWDLLSRMKGQHYSAMSIVFEDVNLKRATNIPKQGTVVLNVTIAQGTGTFEITEGGMLVVNGKVRSTTNPSEEMVPNEFLPEMNDEELLTEQDIYKEQSLRGYEYSGVFRGIKSISITGKKGKLMWLNNWASFTDSMLQMLLFNRDYKDMLVPTGIQKVTIDISMHNQMLRSMPEENRVFPAYLYEDYNMMKVGGVEIRGVVARAISRRRATRVPTLQEYGFVAYRDKKEITLQETVEFIVQLSFENHLTLKVKIIEVVDDDDVVTNEELLSRIFIKVVDNSPLIQAQMMLATRTDRFSESLPSNITVIDNEKIPTDGTNYIACGYNLLSARKANSLATILDSIKNNGFILTRESVINKESIDCLQNRKLDVIMEKKFGTETLLLLKKRKQLPGRIEVIHVDSNAFEWLEKLKAILVAETENKESADMRIILVGEGDPECGLLGFANCLRKEPGGSLVRTFVIQDEGAPKFSLESSLYATQLELDMAVNILRPRFVWGSYRQSTLPLPKPKPVCHAYVTQTVHSDLNSLRWVQGPLTSNADENRLVYITHAALNFRDVMVATGKLSLEAILCNRRNLDSLIGFEYSGVTATGRRVMGIGKSRCLSNMYIMDDTCTWDVPDHFTLEDAATIPCTYGTCCYAFYLFGNMKKGDKVLIHSGTGGIGQAAINLALKEGCEIFTTVGTRDKRKFIKEHFPSIADDHIGNSRDTSFEQMVLEQTNGRGVDIVLNSLSEEKLQASVRCLASGGRFLEIGKYDMVENNHIKMKPFLKDISYYSITLDHVVTGLSTSSYQFSECFKKYLQQNAFKPLTRTCFAKDEVESALRYMTAGTHVGKVLVKICDNTKDSITAPILAYPRFQSAPNKSYIIFGGLGGLGLEVADWLVSRGAQHLVLVSRGSIKNGYQEYRINTWKSYGVKTSIISGVDASTREGCEFILRSAEKEAPVDGIFNLAAVLRDNFFVNQTVKDFEDSVRPKSWVTKRLDEASRKLCPNLRYFVIFSSGSCGIGAAGQTNYGLGNSVMERICEKRVAEGLPALAVQWGAVGQVGLLANMQNNNQEIIVGGTVSQKVVSCLEELDKFLMQDKPIVSSMVVAEKSSSNVVASTAHEAVLNIMGLKDLTGVSMHTSLAELGMDSMMAVEIKQTLEREFEVFLNPQDIRNLTFAKIMEYSGKSPQESTDTSKEVVEELNGIKLFFRTLRSVVSDSRVYIQLPIKEPETNNEIFIFPGLDGNATVFSNLTAHLKHPATCFQMGVNDVDNVEALVEYFLPHVLERSKHRKDFAIVGYSFGALLAIELVRELEARNYTGKLILIEGSPDFVKSLKKSVLPASRHEELQTNFVIALVNMLHPEATVHIIPKLSACKTWEQKIDVVLENLPLEVERLSIADAKAASTTVYKRFISIENYDASNSPPLRTPITLLKAAEVSARNVEADYGLRKITTGEVKVHEIQGNHYTILENQEVALVINNDLKLHS